MRFTTAAALAATAIGGALLLSGAPADAAKKKANEPYFFSSQSQRVIVQRPRSRITIRRERSYLDPGNEVLPGERKYTEYATPYGYSAIDVLGPGMGWNRTPFNDPFDVPSRSRSGFQF